MTPQSSRVAAAIRAGDINVTVVSNDIFDNMYVRPSDIADPNSVVRAITWNDTNIYLRNTSTTILSDAVHEGTHVLDFLGGTEPATVWESEFGAFSAERDFQIGSGQIPEHATPDDVWFHIWEHYENGPLRPQ